MSELYFSRTSQLAPATNRKPTAGELRLAALGQTAQRRLSTPANRVLVLVAGLTILGFGLRLTTMRDSLLGDELTMFNIVHGRSLGQAMSIIRNTENTPPLVFILNWFTSRLGDPTYWVRLPSLLCGTALIPLAYALGARIFSRMAGLLAAALVTLSAFAIFYGVEDRSYAAVACFSALSTLCLVRALESGRRGWWVGYGIAVLAAMYSHYIGFFVLLVQAAWAFRTHREHLKALVIVHGLIVLAYLPWLPSFLTQEKHSAVEGVRLESLAPASLTRFGLINGQDLFGHPFASLSHIPGSIELGVAICVVVLAALATVGRIWQRPGWPNPGSPRILIGLLAFAGPVGIAIVSLRPGMSFMIARNLSASFVLAMVLFGGLIATLRRTWAVPAAGALLIVSVIGAASALEPQYRRTPFRLAAHFIEAHSKPSDPVIQFSFFPGKGPLTTNLSINFNHPRSVYQTPAGQATAWRRGRQGENVFVVLDLGGVLKSAKSLPARNGPGNRFVRMLAHRYVGLNTVLVAEYRYRGP